MERLYGSDQPKIFVQDPDPTKLLKLTIVCLFRVKLRLLKKLRKPLVFNPYWKRRRKREERSASQMRDPTRLNRISLCTLPLLRPPIHLPLVLAPETPAFSPLMLGGVVYRLAMAAAVELRVREAAVCLR
jgi:hypothetical protein